MELEVGYGLVRLVDATKGGDLLERIVQMRRQIALELGMIVPPIRIRDNLQLGPNDYVVKIRGQIIGRATTVRKARDVVRELVEEYVEAVDRLTDLAKV